ncbi:hypothetical protein [Anaerocolumna xylanovorans]|uniref:Sulfatase-modifying factor enzyme 1 n=1 Tax=Anaerocolumna xylanovorans DSM 12503 TaxID=1121345 RepID=A0A1M7YBQ3_9FIRM|nr:hypothetical protein [Anaerocolumna xylanovorans]SHO50055.1 hypothetical protein SAMN02745217_02555 [Anaerocolumna xylanovorans DSM 12503]
MNNYNFDALKFAAEGITGGGGTVLLDDAGLPSFMVPVAKRTNAQLFTGGSEKTHSAFVIDDVEYSKFYHSMFINCMVNGLAYSWPNMDPRASINYDDSHKACNAKGAGWHLASIAERAVIDHLIYKSGVIPRGNTQFGKSHSYTYEAGVGTASESDGAGGTRITRTATGSGPATWTHDGTRSGIADWVGNVWKWTSGLRIVNGEIQIFVGNQAAKQVSHVDASTYWKAIKPDGSLVAPGTTGTLKFTSTGTIGTDRVAATSTSKAFKDVAAASGVTMPEILKELHLLPCSDITTYQGTVYLNTDGERLPFVGGSCNGASNAGPSALGLSDPRSYVGAYVGFFSAFMEL